MLWTEPTFNGYLHIDLYYVQLFNVQYIKLLDSQKRGGSGVGHPSSCLHVHILSIKQSLCRIETHLVRTQKWIQVLCTCTCIKFDLAGLKGGLGYEQNLNLPLWWFVCSNILLVSHTLAERMRSTRFGLCFVIIEFMPLDHVFWPCIAQEFFYQFEDTYDPQEQ